MRLWRISNYADLSGQGGLLAEGRWHSMGKPIVYSAESPAGALIEVLVHLRRELLPTHIQLIELEIAVDLASEAVDAAALPPDWMAVPVISRAAGDQWLTSNRTLMLRVPSAILPDTWNVLLNPAHSGARYVRIARTTKVPLDPRLGAR